MWKESLRIGVDHIDKQHIEIFKITDELLVGLRSGDEGRKKKCADTVLYLKSYAVKHFADEEVYMKSIDYPDFDAHKMLHNKFRENVLQHEKTMLASDYAHEDIKNFTGMLIAWLLYHISDADQKIHKAHLDTLHKYDCIVCGSVGDTINKMTRLNQSVIIIEKHNETFNDSLAVEISFVGDISGHVTYVYSTPFIKNMIHSIMNYVPEEIDELVISALYETSNIISGTICGQIARAEGIFCDITTPKKTQRHKQGEMLTLDTGIGVIEVDLQITYNKPK
ncbi:MAG: hemerythrin domain-containing protein [Oscillospiraceae bacterium]|nr:hemerythrin domain-containing protein [Oscillospiraceae bacterium]